MTGNEIAAWIQEHDAGDLEVYLWGGVDAGYWRCGEICIETTRYVNKNKPYVVIYPQTDI